MMYVNAVDYSLAQICRTANTWARNEMTAEEAMKTIILILRELEATEKNAAEKNK
jgi:hypothetical protein